jgi:type IV secretory pathway VirJ component
MRSISVALLCGVFAAGAACAADIKPERIDGSPLGPVHYYAPPQGHKIDGLVIVISDRQGWDAAATALAQHLTQDAEVVVGLDLPIYSAALKKDTNDCSAVNRDLEVLARQVENDLPFNEFRPPVVIGIGAGAGIAYTEVGEVLPNTFAGGIGLRFDPAFDVGHKMCLPLAPTPPGAPLRYGPVPGHETPWLFTPSPAFAAPDGGMNDFVAAMPLAHILQPKADDFATVDDAIRQIPRIGKAEESIDGLPIVEVAPPATQTSPHPLVIFYSGDGGWRDIDKTMGGYLAEQGYFVVGIDSLRYFWRKKSPQEAAGDLDRLIRHYHAKAKGNGVILVGYSFGADVLPFMVNRMAPDTKAEIKLMTLFGIADRASFKIRLQGILGAANTDGPQTLPELMKLKNIPIQCVFGADEKDSVCAQHELDGLVTRDQESGGHHFDGDYRRTADLIVTADKARLEKAK